MDVLVIGAGAREHALAWRLARDESVRRVTTAPGNAGTAAVGRRVEDLNMLDPSAVAWHATRERYDLVVVGSEAPLAAGVADALRQASIAVFGPDAAAARLESSKAYAKDRMRRAGVPTADAVVFTDLDAALAHARAAPAPPVLKADWLAAGKGVVVPETTEQAEAALRAIFDEAPPDARVLVEERLTGREVSAFALVSGADVVPLAAACDYKRLHDRDEGPNTGGMGAYAPVPWFDRSAQEEVAASVFEPIAWRMARDGTPYRGVLYAGLMLTSSGPMVLEFNVRFGDPEAQVLMPLLDGDLAAALLATATGDRGLMEESVATRAGAAVGVVVAAEGYPDQPMTGREIAGIDPATPGEEGPVLCFHAGTRRARSGAFETAGGRVATFVGIGADLTAARDAAYRGVVGCSLEGAQYRADIGLRELAAASAT